MALHPHKRQDAFEGSDAILHLYLFLEGEPKRKHDQRILIC